MKTKSPRKGRPRRTEKKTKAKGKPRPAKTDGVPPGTVEPRDGRRKGEARTNSDAREEARALAERIKLRFAALLKEPK